MTKPAPILSPSFVWIPASSHSTVDAFRERQRARVIAAQGSATERAKIRIVKGKS